MRILGIETSCDETAAAVVRDGRHILKSEVASQLRIHKPFRGVVPELASRAHVERINEVIDRVIGTSRAAPVDAVAVTTGPGLIGCLLVGSVTARTWGWVHRIPVVGVNHLEGHLFAGLLEHPDLKPPFLGLIVSGGHTELILFKGYGAYQRLGATRDDAAGEAFDKVANLLGLPFPGGPSIDRVSRNGDRRAVAFPRAWIPGTHDFSFSGLKTSVANYVRASSSVNRVSVPDLAASFQEAVVEVLVQKTFSAARRYGLKQVVVGGGVAANHRLRDVFHRQSRSTSIRVYLPNLSFCTDNAAMIAAAGYFKLRYGPRPAGTLDVNADHHVQSWTAR